MDDILFRSRLSMPVITGTPATQRPNEKSGQNQDSDSFKKVFEEQLQTSRNSLQFSKHAVQRLEQRDISISESSMQRLQAGMEIAQQKGLDDTLILIDNTAFIVSAKNETIITAISGEDLKGKAITNINGTVIM